MQAKSSVAIVPLLTVVSVLLLTGCETVEKYSLTYRLWDNDDWRNFSEPAPKPNLALFEVTNHSDVLVQYDALSERHSTVSRHAYFLHLNQARIEAGTKPELVKPSATYGWKSIPLLPAPGDPTNRLPGLPAYAVVNNEGRGFTLFRPPEAEAPFELPVYAESFGTPTRVVLTPFAVAGDTVMVGVVAVVAGFFVWLEMGAPH